MTYSSKICAKDKILITYFLYITTLPYLSNEQKSLDQKKSHMTKFDTKFDKKHRQHDKI